MKIPFLDLTAQYKELENEINNAALSVLSSGWYTLGKECSDFETSLKNYLVGNEKGHVVGVNSGTDALVLSLIAAGIETGDEVITVANSAIPTVTAICSVGAVPVFAEINAETWLMEPSLLNDVITDRTRAVIPVHLYGTPVEMGPIIEWSKNKNLIVIEDAAQACGASYKDKKTGTLGDFGVFSFYPTKNLGACGDAGAIFINDDDLYEKLLKLRNYGQSSRCKVDILRGHNSRLDEIQAAILSVKLKYLDGWNSKRSELAESYKGVINIKRLPLKYQKQLSHSISTYHLFPVIVETGRRDEFMKYCSKKGVETFIHYPTAAYNQIAFSRYKRSSLRLSEEIATKIVSLPMHQYINKAEMEYIANTIEGFFKF